MKAKWLNYLAILFLLEPAIASGQFSFMANGNDTLTLSKYSGGGAVMIPASTNAMPVVAIAQDAFLGSGVTSVTIPGSVTNIGQDAFNGCDSLTNVVIYSNALGAVLTIGDYAFDGCPALSSVVIDGNVSIGADAFSGGYGSSLTNLLMPAVVNIGDYAFFDSALGSVTIPGTVTNIGLDAFGACWNLTNLTLSNNVSIGEEEFAACSQLQSVFIPASVTNIGMNAFQFCSSLRGIFFYSNAPTVDPTAFSYDNATVYYLPGTSGWSSNCGGLPTAVWGPQFQTIVAKSNQFACNICWVSGRSIQVQFCTNLAQPVWNPVTNFVLSNASNYFQAPIPANAQVGYYRAISQ